MRVEEAQVLTELSAQQLVGEPVEEDGVLFFHLGDDEDAVSISHEFGDPEEAAKRIIAAGRALIEHGEQIRYRARQRTAGWT